jgi:hypothetical protein
MSRIIKIPINHCYKLPIIDDTNNVSIDIVCNQYKQAINNLITIVGNPECIIDNIIDNKLYYQIRNHNIDLECECETYEIHPNGTCACSIECYDMDICPICKMTI